MYFTCTSLTWSMYSCPLPSLSTDSYNRDSKPCISHAPPSPGPGTSVRCHHCPLTATTETPNHVFHMQLPHLVQGQLSTAITVDRGEGSLQQRPQTCYVHLAQSLDAPCCRHLTDGLQLTRVQCTASGMKSTLLLQCLSIWDQSLVAPAADF